MRLRTMTFGGYPIEEFRMDVYRRGPYVTVTVTHTPTGTAATCDRTPSETQNRDDAMAEVLAALAPPPQPT